LYDNLKNASYVYKLLGIIFENININNIKWIIQRNILIKN